MNIQTSGRETKIFHLNADHPVVIQPSLRDEDCACSKKNFKNISFWYGSGHFWDCPIHGRETTLRYQTKHGNTSKYYMYITIQKILKSYTITIADRDYEMYYPGFKTSQAAEDWINQFREIHIHEDPETEKVLNSLSGLDPQVIFYMLNGLALIEESNKIRYFNEADKINIANRTKGIVPGLRSYRGRKSNTIIHHARIHTGIASPYNNKCCLELFPEQTTTKIKAGEYMPYCKVHGVDAFSGINRDIRFAIYNNFRNGRNITTYKENGLNFCYENKIYLRSEKLGSAYVVMTKGDKELVINEFKSHHDAWHWVDEMRQNPIAADKAFAKKYADKAQQRIEKCSSSNSTFIHNALTLALSLDPKKAVAEARLLLDILESKLDDDSK